MLMASRYRPGGRKPVTTNDPRSASGESPVRFHHDDIVRDTIASGGGKGIRTPDLLTASQALYQLSYTPEGVLTIAAVASLQEIQTVAQAARRGPAIEE